MTEDIWDELAPHYDDWFETPAGAFVLGAEIAALLHLTGDLTGLRGLEVGCGTGQFGRAFARQGAWMVGLDRSRSMLDVAARTSADHLRLCLADAERLPFASQTFDVVLAVTVLEFIPKLLSALAEMWRVLRPGGQMLVGVLNAWSLWALTRKLLREETPYTSAHFFSLSELLRLLRNFAPARWRGAAFLPPWARGQRMGWWSALENAGARWWPILGAFLVAGTEKPREAKR
ncbi:MAG: class I SAM-dependent methyltransferase [Chloroflexota bacterium]